MHKQCDHSLPNKASSTILLGTQDVAGIYNIIIVPCSTVARNLAHFNGFSAP